MAEVRERPGMTEASGFTGDDASITSKKHEQ